MRLKWWMVFVPTVLIALACSAEINSQLNIDGAPFDPDECRNGTVYGFTGVELIDEVADKKLHVVRNLDGSAKVVLFESGAAIGTTLDNCGTITVADESSEINSVQNIFGEAVLSCSDGTHTVAGDVSFAHCH